MSVFARLRSGETDCRFCLAGGLLLLVAALVAAWGYQYGDIATALGALLLVPAGGLLIAVGLSRGTDAGARPPLGGGTD